MDPSRAEEILRARLADRGVALIEREQLWYAGGGEDAPAAWHAWRELCREPLEPWIDLYGNTCRYGDGDQLAFTVPAPTSNVFTLEFHRRMGALDSDGRYLETMELVLSVEFERTPALEALYEAGCRGKWHLVPKISGAGPGGDARGDALRSDSDLDLSSWIGAVEASPFFVDAFAQGATGFDFQLQQWGD